MNKKIRPFKRPCPFICLVKIKWTNMNRAPFVFVRFVYSPTSSIVSSIDLNLQLFNLEVSHKTNDTIETQTLKYLERVFFSIFFFEWWHIIKKEQARSYQLQRRFQPISPTNTFFASKLIPRKREKANGIENVTFPHNMRTKSDIIPRTPNGPTCWSEDDICSVLLVFRNMTRQKARIPIVTRRKKREL